MCQVCTWFFPDIDWRLPRYEYAFHSTMPILINCSVCQLGCTQCADGPGTCISCKTGFTQNANDKTKCNPVSSQTTDGIQCPDGSFSTGAQCATCSPACRTC